jgi:putative Mn2+ efflux pump MntP
MGILNLLFMAVGLSMDAFAVSVCKGMAMKEMNWKNALKAGLYFGGFQALMPALGYLLGSRLHSLIAGVDHWIAWVCLFSLEAR